MALATAAIASTTCPAVIAKVAHVASSAVTQDLACLEDPVKRAAVDAMRGGSGVNGDGFANGSPTARRWGASNDL